MGTQDLMVMSSASSRTLARESVRWATRNSWSVLVVDLDGSYVSVADEAVARPQDFGLTHETLSLWAAAFDERQLVEEVSRALLPMAEEGVLPHVVRAGVLLVGPASSRGGRLLDVHAVSSGSMSVNATGELLLGGQWVEAVDLSRVDPERPWLLDPLDPAPTTLLSAHSALASFVAETCARLRDDAVALAGRHPDWDLTRTSLDTPIDDPIRHLYRRALQENESGTPDAFDPTQSAAFLAWLASPSAPDRPARYLESLLATRPDLQAAFPAVPGTDTAAFLTWVDAHGRLEGYPSGIIDAALRSTPVLRRPVTPARPAPGVTVVGYLTGELGIGESARQLVSALSAAGVAHATRPVDLHLASRQRAASVVNDGQVLDTTLICVNADLTPAVVATIPDLVRRSYRIGMWYWEVEDFPPSQHGAFAAVDEVWVATDFVRRAIEPHSPVPVRTLTPPLPQRGASPTLTRADLGLPDRPIFLFSFDYLSTAERKNPVGLVDAFERAFRPGEGPVLVIKSINADKRVADAERLRLRAAARPDILLLEEYLDPAARDALVARCDCYVSLHRSEGLGLTMAEAMAWGKPVIATGYSGNLQFMNEENSFLVPWAPCAIPSDAAPYPPGGVWADPDLDVAAAFMRVVVDSPEIASARGQRAADDIATLHSAAVAGRAIAARLAELERVRRARAGRSVLRAVRSSVRAAAAAFRDELR